MSREDPIDPFAPDNDGRSPPENNSKLNFDDPKIVDDPLIFARERLGLHCWHKMEEIFRAVQSGERKILVRSCNGAGKTTAIAALCNWKLSQFEDSIVLRTASSWMQVKRSLWGEIRKQARLSELYKPKQISTTHVNLTDKHYALGISPSKPENAQGFHAGRMLIAVDEATGVSRDTMDALLGNATGEDAQIVLICNPIATDSYPYEAEQSGEWKLITIGALEHPNVTTGIELIPGAVTRKWIEDRLRSWSYEVGPGENRSLHIPWLDKYFRRTARVESRILGEWPEDENDGFIEMALIKRTLNTESEKGEKFLGVDVARHGDDDTVFAFFDGNVQLPFEQFRGKDLMKTANRIEQLYREGWTAIAIDDTGIGGGVCDRLKELGVPHHAVNFAASPVGFLRGQGKIVANKRAEMYFILEEEIRRERVRLINDREFLQELGSARLQRMQSSSEAYRLEDKESIRRRLGRSPDKADAAALARYAAFLQARAGRPRIL